MHHRFAADLAAGAPELPVLIYGGEGPDDLTARCAAKDGTFSPVDTAADDVAMLASTSGTTGQPKVAMHFHRDVLATADSFATYLIKPHRDDVFTGTPRSASPTGSAACCCSRSARARRPCSSSAPPRPNWPTRSRPTA